MTVTGVTVTGRVLAANGTVALPAISFASDPNSGFYWDTTSDYRRKSKISAVKGFWERLMALNPISFMWDIGGWDRGFLAHEFAKPYPRSVNGEKDAVDADGKPIHQSMQASTSEVMADVAAALQDIQRRLTAAGL